MRALYIIGLILFQAAGVWGQDNPSPSEWIVTTNEVITHKTNLTNYFGIDHMPSATVEPLTQDGSRYLLSVPSEIDAFYFASRLRKSGKVYAIQPNLEIDLRSIDPPNDNLHNDQWYMEMVKAADAWSLSIGGTNALDDTIVIAVIDNGFDVLHEDLFENIYSNRHEVPNDGIDNDGNGFIDDISGWNFTNGNSVFDEKNHGTSVLGLIGAKGNNQTGIAGVNWKVKLMPISIDNRLSSLIKAFDYVKTMRQMYNDSNGERGAFIVASSYSGGKNFQFAADNPVWCGMYDALGEVGILSIGATTNLAADVDVFGDMPSTCPSDYLIVVTSTDQIDSKLIGAGYGEVSVDLGAPGIDLLTTHIDDIYHHFSGTSAATPLVAGTVGLLYSIPNQKIARNSISSPAETALEIKSYILEGAVAVSDLEGRTTTGGRLDLANTMRALSRANGGTKLGLQINNVYPNPANINTRIQVHLDDLQLVEWTVSDALGRVIYYEKEIPFDYPVATKVLDTENWPVGNYFLKVQQGNFLKTEKILVIR